MVARRAILNECWSMSEADLCWMYDLVVKLKAVFHDRRYKRIHYVCRGDLKKEEEMEGWILMEGCDWYAWVEDVDSLLEISP